MTVLELKKMLENYPDNMEIITDRFSDYTIVEEEEFKIVKAVLRDHWLMRSHPTMSEEDKLLEKEYLHLDGN